MAHEGMTHIEDLVLALNDTEEQMYLIVDELGAHEGMDKRRLALAKTNIENAVMWAKKAINLKMSNDQ